MRRNERNHDVRTDWDDGRAVVGRNPLASDSSRGRAPVPSSSNFAVTYSRVSSAEQADRNLSIPSQIQAARSWASERGLDILHDYEDAGFTGMSADRPGLQALLADAGSPDRTWSHVLCYTSDRLARKEYVALGCEMEFRRLGIEVHYIAEPRVEGPEGELLRSFMRGINEWFCMRLSASVKRGQAQRRRQGLPHGQAAFGYRWLDSRHLVPDEKEAPVLRLIFDLAEQGESYASIVRRLNAMSIPPRRAGSWRYHSNIRRLLCNPVYAGYLTAEPKFHRTEVANHHQECVPRSEWQLVPSDCWEPLIDRERWGHMQGLVAARSRKAAKATPYLFSGIIACPFCGCGGHLIGATQHSKRGKTYHRYVCNVEPRAHRRMSWPRDHIDSRIIAALEGEFKDYAPAEIHWTRPAGSTPQVEIVILETRVTEIDREIERVKLGWERGVLEEAETKHRLAAKKGERKQVLAQIEELKSKPVAPNPEEALKLTRSLGDIARDDTLPVQIRRAILASHIETIDLPRQADKSVKIPTTQAGLEKFIRDETLPADVRLAVGELVMVRGFPGRPVAVSLTQGPPEPERFPDRIASIRLYAPSGMGREPARGIEPPTS